MIYAETKVKKSKNKTYKITDNNFEKKINERDRIFVANNRMVLS